MKILAIDIGTGTQDILLYDSRLEIENSLKLVAPSPTMILRQKIQAATRRGEALCLNGVMMGGGPGAWAAEAHLHAGLPLYATPAAARTFNDDLEAVRELGVTLVSEDEADRLPESVRRITLADFDLQAIRQSWQAFGVQIDDLDVVAVAVFDHGDAPPEISDRQFRFDYLDERLRQANRLSAFAYLADQAPPIMTRLCSVVETARRSADPLFETAALVVMDTAPAAVLGATFDPRVAERAQVIIANIGNFHSLAFRLGPGGIEGVFEHHTGFLNRSRLESLLKALADGSLKHSDVFGEHGHGALVYDARPLALFDTERNGVVVTGPRRQMMQGSRLYPYFAAPFGDMMLAGCYGLLAAVADLLPDLGQPLRAALAGVNSSGIAPWDV
ncbi:MAG: DUF1786 family protein [Anaerolineales bacterium]|jgi:uncharacterized protein (DUF1786 family)|nr:DUF1786 family protein [Anaerolineales bacterium]